MQRTQPLLPAEIIDALQGMIITVCASAASDQTAGIIAAMNLPIAPAQCRPGCGACCTAPSITSPIPGMPHGKPAGVRCVQLDDDQRCLIFGRPERPAFCGGLQPAHDMCGESRTHALHWLGELERATAP